MKPDVLVVGAGPAGSAAAIVLARAGLRVTLTDRRDFPRDKTCGDSLLPDSLDALTTLGLLERVRQSALPMDTLRVYAPSGARADIRGRYATVTRRVFDEALRAEAAASGATFLAPLKVIAPVEKDGAVAGAEFEVPDGGTNLTVEAGVTLLATGASAGPLETFGIRARGEPEAFAVRTYVEPGDGSARDDGLLTVAYHRSICPGYGWIFPLPGGVFNVGVGLLRRRGQRMEALNLRTLWSSFTEAFPPARDLVRNARRIDQLQGAPLSTSFDGEGLGRRGLLVVGEAGGMTYPFTGEGIGKAMQSGILAAEAVMAEHERLGGEPARAFGSYAAAVTRGFRRRFETYRRAQDLLRSPALCSYLVSRVSRGGWPLRQLEGMIGETLDPRFLFTPIGLARAMFG
jgi:geranylgeranyl reductase family protein